MPRYNQSQVPAPPNFLSRLAVVGSRSGHTKRQANAHHPDWVVPIFGSCLRQDEVCLSMMLVFPWSYFAKRTQWNVCSIWVGSPSDPVLSPKDWAYCQKDLNGGYRWECSYKDELSIQPYMPQLHYELHAVHGVLKNHQIQMEWKEWTQKYLTFLPSFVEVQHLRGKSMGFTWTPMIVPQYNYSVVPRHCILTRPLVLLDLQPT